MPLSKIPVGNDPPREINVIIENPLGGDPVKYELDKESGAMFVDRFLHTAMYYPGNYGFVPHTLSGDGDPVDVLVVGRVPVMPGAVMRSRPVGVLVMDDEDIVRSLSTRLKTHGYEVSAAYDGAHATARFHCERPDRLLLDGHLPRWERLDTL